MRTGRVLLLAGLLAGSGVGVLLAHAVHQQESRLLATRQALEQRRTAWEAMKRQLRAEIGQFHGQAGILIEDLQTGWRTGHHPDRPFPAASLVKVPIMAAVYQAAKEGQIRLGETVTLRAADKTGGSGVLKESPNGSVLTVEELVALMITQSDNTATNLLIRRLGYELLNRAFQRMGLSQTRLVREMMDFSRRREGVENTTTAQDVGLVLRKIYRGELVSPAVSERCLALLKRQQLRDRIPAKLPPETPVAHKTGLEKGVCHDSGILFTAEGDLLICVLTRNGGASRPAKRFIARAALHGYRYLTEPTASP